ncbi:Aryl-phospho-beta-D-glucosidase BglC [Lactococcus lactis]|nr:Aryl-phospho-beta-D-glucosidase BglC [Lactococcus lactis]
MAAPVNLRAGDAELLKSAKPDFLGINYYQTATNAWNPVDGGVGVGSFNTSGKKGTTKESGHLSIKKFKILLLTEQIGIGKLTLKA